MSINLAACWSFVHVLAKAHRKIPSGFSQPALKGALKWPELSLSLSSSSSPPPPAAAAAAAAAAAWCFRLVDEAAFMHLTNASALDQKKLIIAMVSWTPSQGSTKLWRSSRSRCPRKASLVSSSQVWVETTRDQGEPLPGN